MPPGPEDSLGGARGDRSDAGLLLEDWHMLAGFAKQHGILFIADEIQTEFGRTGKLFASEHYGLVPDLITTAKSLAGGLPIEAVTGRADVMEAPQVGGLGGTYGGNPLACAAALAVLEAMEAERIPARAQRTG